MGGGDVVRCDSAVEVMDIHEKGHAALLRVVAPTPLAEPR